MGVAQTLAPGTSATSTQHGSELFSGGMTGYLQPFA
jgi:hypothetical protein